VSPVRVGPHPLGELAGSSLSLPGAVGAGEQSPDGEQQRAQWSRRHASCWSLAERACRPGREANLRRGRRAARNKHQQARQRPGIAAEWAAGEAQGQVQSGARQPYSAGAPTGLLRGAHTCGRATRRTRSSGPRRLLDAVCWMFTGRRESQKTAIIQQHLLAIRRAENLDRQTHFKRSQGEFMSRSNWADQYQTLLPPCPHQSGRCKQEASGAEWRRSDRRP